MRVGSSARNENKALAELKQTTKALEALTEAEARRLEVESQMGSGLLCEDGGRAYQSLDGRVVRDMFKGYSKDQVWHGYACDTVPSFLSTTPTARAQQSAGNSPSEARSRCGLGNIPREAELCCVLLRSIAILLNSPSNAASYPYLFSISVCRRCCLLASSV